jgi:hypothetical protein
MTSLPGGGASWLPSRLLVVTYRNPSRAHVHGADAAVRAVEQPLFAPDAPAVVTVRQLEATQVRPGHRTHESTALPRRCGPV